MMLGKLSMDKAGSLGKRNSPDLWASEIAGSLGKRNSPDLWASAGQIRFPYLATEKYVLLCEKCSVRKMPSFQTISAEVLWDCFCTFWRLAGTFKVYPFVVWAVCSGACDVAQVPRPERGAEAVSNGRWSSGFSHFLEVLLFFEFHWQLLWVRKSWRPSFVRLGQMVPEQSYPVWNRCFWFLEEMQYRFIFFLLSWANWSQHSSL